jgi:hypothetical protein
VRGEFLGPWGVAEAERLGLTDVLQKAGAEWIPWIIGLGADRDLTASTPQRCAALSFSHPPVQTAPLEAAAEAGAEVRQNADVGGIITGHAVAAVEYIANGQQKMAKARLVAAPMDEPRPPANGRISPCIVILTA